MLVEAMAQAILHAVHQRDKLPDRAAAARRLAEKRADWRENFKVLLDAYQMALE